MCCSRKIFNIILCILALGSFTPAAAQILVGPKAGVQYGWIGLDRDIDREFLNTRPPVGVPAGGVAIFRIRERVDLHTELLYAFRQQVITGELDDMLKSTSMHHFIEVPISFKVNFKSSISNLRYQWFAGAGPNISYWLGGQTRLKSSELDETDRSPSDYKYKFSALPDTDADPDRLYIEEPNRLQLGIHVVTGLMFEPQEGTAFIIDLRFDYGHSYFAREDYGYFPGLLDYAEPMRARYQALKLGVTYVFDTKVSASRKGKSTVKDRKRK